MVLLPPIYHYFHHIHHYKNLYLSSPNNVQTLFLSTSHTLVHILKTNQET